MQTLFAPTHLAWVLRNLISSKLVVSCKFSPGLSATALVLPVVCGNGVIRPGTGMCGRVSALDEGDWGRSGFGLAWLWSILSIGSSLCAR